MRKIAVLLTLVLLTSSPALLSPASSAQAVVVSVKASSAAVDIGQLFTVSGKVTGAKQGDVVKVQVKAPGAARWTTAKRVTLNKRLKYSAKIALRTPGSNGVRAVHGALKSPPLTIKGYKWLDLTAQGHMANAGFAFMGTDVKMGGTTYPRSIWASSASSWLWNLTPGVCTNLSMVLGRSTDFDPAIGGFIANTWLFNDGPGYSNIANINGDPVAENYVVPEDAEQLYIDLNTFVDGVDAAVGTPRIRCAASSLPAIDPTDAPF